MQLKEIESLADLIVGKITLPGHAFARNDCPEGYRTNCVDYTCDPYSTVCSCPSNFASYGVSCTASDPVSCAAYSSCDPDFTCIQNYA